MNCKFRQQAKGSNVHTWLLTGTGPTVIEARTICMDINVVYSNEMLPLTSERHNGRVAWQKISERGRHVRVREERGRNRNSGFGAVGACVRVAGCGGKSLRLCPLGLGGAEGGDDAGRLGRDGCVRQRAKKVQPRVRGPRLRAGDGSERVAGVLRSKTLQPRTTKRKKGSGWAGERKRKRRVRGGREQGAGVTLSRSRHALTRLSPSLLILR
ncbi:hypothetical protein C8R47DRAFT_1197917 [Mycena vitilis]|nr:hypothetical protein C8R47DRAFT_1197917 [Mycena vitilis]